MTSDVTYEGQQEGLDSLRYINGEQAQLRQNSYAVNLIPAPAANQLTEQARQAVHSSLTTTSIEATDFNTLSTDTYGEVERNCLETIIATTGYLDTEKNQVLTSTNWIDHG